MTLVLELGIPLVLKTARFNSHTPAVVQFCHPPSNRLINITVTRSIEHKPWLVDFCFQKPPGQLICAFRAVLMFLVDTFSVSR
jgi:hypothetical protein